MMENLENLENLEEEKAMVRSAPDGSDNHIGLAILLVALLSWHPVIEERCVAPHQGDGELLEDSGDLH